MAPFGHINTEGHGGHHCAVFVLKRGELDPQHPFPVLDFLAQGSPGKRQAITAHQPVGKRLSEQVARHAPQRLLTAQAEGLNEAPLEHNIATISVHHPHSAVRYPAGNCPQQRLALAHRLEHPLLLLIGNGQGFPHPVERLHQRVDLVPVPVLVQLERLLHPGETEGGEVVRSSSQMAGYLALEKHEGEQHHDGNGQGLEQQGYGRGGQGIAHDGLAVDLQVEGPQGHLTSVVGRSEIYSADIAEQFASGAGFYDDPALIDHGHVADERIVVYSVDLGRDLLAVEAPESGGYGIQVGLFQKLNGLVKGNLTAVVFDDRENSRKHDTEGQGQQKGLAEQSFTDSMWKSCCRHRVSLRFRGPKS
ncbi:MAG: hypothetical protein ACD_75C02096G0003 [uncultured bacterium]|nr:MAG: hypothetical protein ACD_75C02096G0003 [uncultured bacterium]